jgi:hypothetical protein
MKEASMRPRIRRLYAPVLGFLFLVSAAIAAAAASSPAGSAKGKLTIDGKAAELRHAYAMTQPNVFEKTKMDTAILLTSSPLPDGSLAGMDDLEDGLRMVATGVLFKLDTDGQSIREVLKHESIEGTLQMSGMTRASFTKQTQTKDRISGKIATKGPEELLDHKYSLDATFDAAIAMAKIDAPPPDAKTGQKLPKDGGEPYKSYMAWEKALKDKDVAAMKKFKPADAPDMPDADLKEAAELLAAMSPSNIKFVDGYINGDDAVLYLTGSEGTEKMYGTVPMKKSGGVWRAVKPSWSNTPPK